MGRRRWQHYQPLLMENVHLKEEDKQMEEKDWELSDKFNFCNESSNTSQQAVNNIVPVRCIIFWVRILTQSELKVIYWGQGAMVQWVHKGDLLWVNISFNSIYKYRTASLSCTFVHCEFWNIQLTLWMNTNRNEKLNVIL